MSFIYKLPGHLIRRLQQRSVSIFAAHMKLEGLEMTSPQFAALSMLQEHPGIDQATLSDLIAYDRPTIGGVVDRLVSKGLVERQTNSSDRRARVLKITPKGESLLRHLKPKIIQLESEILDGLTRTEQKEFIRLAEKITLKRAAVSTVNRKEHA